MLLSYLVILFFVHILTQKEYHGIQVTMKTYYNKHTNFHKYNINMTLQEKSKVIFSSINNIQYATEKFLLRF